MTVSSWATLDDVASLTGVQVTEEQLTQAQGMIDLFSGRSYAALARTGSRDVGWLKAAVAYQAAWLTSQPDMFQRMEITSVSDQAGSMQFPDKAQVLAPMAKWALKRVSWLKSRSLHVRSAFVDGPAVSALVSDDHEWQAI